MVRGDMNSKGIIIERAAQPRAIGRTRPGAWRARELSCVPRDWPRRMPGAGRRLVQRRLRRHETAMLDGNTRRAESGTRCPARREPTRKESQLESRDAVKRRGWVPALCSALSRRGRVSCARPSCCRRQRREAKRGSVDMPRWARRRRDGTWSVDVVRRDAAAVGQQPSRVRGTSSHAVCGFASDQPATSDQPDQRRPAAF